MRRKNEHKQRNELKGNDKEMGRIISVKNRPNRTPSQAENDKEMVRKVTSFTGEVMMRRKNEHKQR